LKALLALKFILNELIRGEKKVEIFGQGVKPAYLCGPPDKKDGYRSFKRGRKNRNPKEIYKIN